jgi:hypothetical protein
MAIKTNLKQHLTTKEVLLKNLTDPDLLELAEGRFDKILRSCQEFDEKIAMIQKNPYLNSEGRLFETEKSAQLFVKFMRDLQNDTTFSDKYMNRRNHLLDGYERKTIEFQPENSHLYGEVRQRLAAMHGYGPEAMQSAFQQAALKKQDIVCQALACDPLESIPKKMIMEGQKLLDKDVMTLVEKDPLLTEISQANAAFQSIAKQEIGMLTRSGLIDDLKIQASGIKE